VSLVACSRGPAGAGRSQRPPCRPRARRASPWRRAAARVCCGHARRPV